MEISKIEAFVLYAISISRTENQLKLLISTPRIKGIVLEFIHNLNRGNVTTDRDTLRTLDIKSLLEIDNTPSKDISKQIIDDIVPLLASIAKGAGGNLLRQLLNG